MLKEEPVKGTYYLMHKKIHANRYSTDCFKETLAARALASDWSLNDSPTYKGELATSDEILSQHSLFGKILAKIKAGKDEAEPVKRKK